MQRPAIVDGDRPGRTFEVVDLAHVDGGGILRLEAARPLALVIILIDDRPIVAAAQHAQRALLGRAVEHVGARRAGTVVGVRPKRDVLVPLHFVAALRPFEVQFEW
jgi:hypothetical protein